MSRYAVAEGRPVATEGRRIHASLTQHGQEVPEPVQALSG